jgi:hypothetical protein
LIALIGWNEPIELTEQNVWNELNAQIELIELIVETDLNGESVKGIEVHEIGMIEKRHMTYGIRARPPCEIVQ